ncbi:DNA-processing protein DprA [Pelagibius marinus]|uniref:DNA-processing protein DprA n=1 Tax=Pelagibius marinus TaxID=2762760 RepID=UPI001872E2F3|nr:DNA-processing protein DprA [Pelagibius marinus]
MTEKETKPLSDAARLDWLRLIRSENVGPVVFRQLLERYGTPTAALEALPELARRAGARRKIRLCPPAEAEAEAEAAIKAGVRLLALCEPAYPALLRALDDAPPLLCILGDPAVLALDSVGIVGARNASANGRRFAERLAADIAAAGLAVTSGMARGIDTAAHRGALPRPTVAVLAGGVDIIYPPENEALHAEIAEYGAIISELPLGIVPQARHFPRRNRLISGLSLGVAVVEAARRSGSLITARFAGDQGREVFAVPGSPLDPRAAGCNQLLRDGATLIESAADVLTALGAQRRLATPPPPAGGAGSVVTPPPEAAPAERADIEELLGADPILVDDLVRLSGLPIAVVHGVLLELELAGKVERHPGNRFARLYKAPADPL